MHFLLLLLIFLGGYCHLLVFLLADPLNGATCMRMYKDMLHNSPNDFPEYLYFGADPEYITAVVVQFLEPRCGLLKP